jgi:hydrogenase maturation protein HypF
VTSTRATDSIARCRLVVTGVVQGVGFRPFIHRLAHSLDLNGWVLNSTEGVVIEVEGKPDHLDRFVQTIPAEAPPRARVERVDRTELPPIGYSSFAIEESRESDGQFVLISPDICICDDCLREMRDPTDRRYRYPFINCTNCGPRFTLVKDIPYDRPKTTMACFPMCPECGREYHDPADRRFHAQPNACPVCGPHVWLVDGPKAFDPPLPGEEGRGEGEAAIQEARHRLASGAILAIKGLGGFHLACDATDDDAVSELRRRKQRSDKPFAVMAPDADTVATFCHLSQEERQLLESPQRPIVLLRRKDDTAISPLVAPGNRFLGVMLPYTPLHHLLLQPSAIGDRHPAPSTQHYPVALLMTSGNLSEEPIATGNREALDRLSGLADAFLLHNRDIEVRCDDSVTRLFRGSEAVIRRSRGYAPFPVRLGFESRDLLACGGELKSTFCITRGNYAFLSQHIGDLENAETLQSYVDSVEHFRRLFRLDVTAVAHDLHPEYLSTRYAWEMAEGGAKLPLVPVQHHHAHIAACMAENGVDEPVLGVSFDGTGYGDDGHLWGGEFLVADFAGYRRAAHFKYLRLPGGEAAIRRPGRMAVSYLLDGFGPEILEEKLPPLQAMDSSEVGVIRRQIERGLNSPLTSSVGRLFDAVSALLGVRQVVNYEGQAAIEMEMAATAGVLDSYRWDLLPGQPMVIDPAPAIRQVVDDMRRGVPVGVISARFHNSVAEIVAECCRRLRQDTGIGVVALSGGVFQNLYLLERCCLMLESDGFRVLIHHQVPANDGGIALGQAVVANRVLGK